MIVRSQFFEIYQVLIINSARMQILTSTVNQNNIDEALHPELQFARCMSNRYKNDLFPRCVSCTRRWAGDTCRFQGIRFFLKDSQRNIVGISFVEAQKADMPTMDFPNTWNVPLKPAHIKRTKVRFFLKYYQQEINVDFNYTENDCRSVTADSSQRT